MEENNEISINQVDIKVNDSKHDNNNNDDEEYDENETHERLVTNNGSIDILGDNSYEFNKFHWEQLVNDRSNKTIAIAMATQGSTRYDNSNDNEENNSFTQKYLYEKGMLYVYQRKALIERLEKGFEARKDKDKRLSNMFPVYIAPPIIEITVQVTCQIMKAAPKTKKIKFKREEGLDTLILLAKQAHKGISMKTEYNLYFTNDLSIQLTEENLLDVEENTALTLKEAPPAPVVKSNKSISKTNEKAASSKSTATSTVVNLRLQNSIRLIEEDVNMMVLPVSTNVNFHEKMSYLTYMVYWGTYVLNTLHHLVKDMKNNVIELSKRELIDCLISLQRCMKENRNNYPFALLHDAEELNKLLFDKITSSLRINLLVHVTEDYPDLIDKSSYDYLTPRVNRLYDEQGKVLDLLHDAITYDKPILIGYRVPPSGGKTILSVAIAAMIEKYHCPSDKDKRKRLLYVCYNTLVRLSVANACEQSNIPFWVASTRKNEKVVGKGASVVATSFTCRDRSRNALRKRRNEAKMAAEDGSDHKIGHMVDMIKYAENETIHFNPIIVSDVTSAVILLDLYPDKFIVYLDEPTAGAENGIEGNDMQKWVAKILSKIPNQTVMLSATLPNLLVELPAIHKLPRAIVAREKLVSSGFNNFTSTSDGYIVMIETQRLPVGCVAVSPTGEQVLPHEISETFEEFQKIVSSLSTDALMLRFYTPGPVYKLAKVVEKTIISVTGSIDYLPSNLQFNNVITNIGDISHLSIRTYAKNLLVWISSLVDVNIYSPIYQALKSMRVPGSNPVNSETFVVDHVASEGRALAVTTTYPVKKINSNPDVVEYHEILKELIAKSMNPYIDKIPEVHKHLSNFLARKAEYEHQYNSFMKSKDKEKEQKAEALVAPSFEWPIQIAGFSAVLTDIEMTSLPGDVVAGLLSGLGSYDPSSMSRFEESVVMREAGHGHLACLFSSPDIVYGTNMSLITVFVGSGYGQIATRNSLYQLIGRAGRTGRSHKAKVLFQDYLTMRKALIPENEKQSFEAQVINWHIDRQLNE